MAHYRAGFISDVHLGTRGSDAVALLRFLKDHEFETLYLVGDIIDVWALRRGIFWPQEHNDVIQKLLRKGRKGTRLIYIPGNHDEFVRYFFGAFGSVTIQKSAIHRAADGRRILVMHGHELDVVVQGMGWLAHLGDIGYKLLMEMNWVVNAARALLGRPHWSLSAYVKREVKNVVSFIGKFEEEVARYARRYSVDAVLCGHIHTAAERQVGGITYLNCGDWVESRTAIVEHFDGTMELLRDLHLAVGGDGAPEAAHPYDDGLGAGRVDEAEPALAEA
ncbi:MAG: UDP-2,3-diacylglucosamine diphosphatase [Verrucomicrobiae bacterium]|nr:UDP-2,3-diacylglucosamine diphosphatase [Verrucomicrobiae bacterium]